MQEDVERRTVAISITATKLTARTLANAVTAIGKKICEEYKEGQTPHGKQSVKKLMNHGVATNSLPLDGNTKLFDSIAEKYNVDYAFHKTAPNQYLLFFKASQADVITACFSEYSKAVMARSAKPSIMKQIEKFANFIKSRIQEPQQRTRERGATHEER